MKVLPISNPEVKISMDKKDKEILSVLCKNARLPLAKIGQIVGLSRESVEYRINKLNDEHILAGSIAVINVRKLKNFSFHVFMSLHNPAQEEIFIKRAMEDKDVNSLIKYSGKLDFELSIMTSSHEKFQEIYSRVTQGLTMQEENTLVLLNMIKGVVLPKKFLSAIGDFEIKKNDLSFFKDFNKAKKNNYKIDDIDLLLLKILSKDAQIKIKELAEKVKLSADAVTYRIRKLIENSYITEFRPVIDFSKLNLSIQAMLIKTNNITKEDLR
jgi:DNA-binding Lrp family transcriptional regulator